MSKQSTAPASGADTARPVLLVASTDLRANGIGALFLRDIIASAPEITFVVHQEMPFLLGEGKFRWAGLAALFRLAAARVPIFHLFRLTWFRAQLVRARIAAIAEAADQQGADRIWITASTPELIWIGEQLAASGRDVRVTVWDAPEYLAGNLGLPTGMRHALLQAFGNLLRQAQGVSVIGRAMQSDYKHLYGVQSEIIRHGVDTMALPDRRQRTEVDALRIVFAGSLYSKEEWNSFTDALIAADWTVGGRRVLLYFIGRFPLSGARKPAEVVFLGEKPFAEAQKILSTMDIGYLPYWFDRRREVPARTSFPGKLSAYSAAGLAIFHHAPPYTEVTAFLEIYPFGLTCHSLEPHDVIDVLERLIEGIKGDKHRQARETALREELSQKAMALPFRRFMERKSV